MTSLLVPNSLENIEKTQNIPPGSKGFRFGEIVGLKAGDELDDLLWRRDECFSGRRRELDVVMVGVTPPLFGSNDDGIEIKEGLPIEGPPLVGPKVGVDPADFTVAGDVSVLPPWSKVTVLSTCP